MHNVEILKGPYNRQAAKRQIERRLETPCEIAEKFRQKLSEMKAAEMAKKEKGEEYDPHWDYINPEDFTDEQAVYDAEILKKFQEKTLTFDEFNDARNEVSMSLPKDGKDHSEDSRPNFYYYLTNKTASSRKWRKLWGLKGPKH